MNTDAELLARFTDSGDESAFREIVERHAPMVQGVAWRRTQNRALAEEITQTVFTILARKAAGLKHGELAGWLHRAAFMETRNACRKEARRSEALQELTTQMTGDTQPDHAWQDIQRHLDEALTRLPAEERQLVVMRYFEQRSYREIAGTTGRTEEGSRKRMQRSLDRLGALLRRKGIVTSGASLGALLAGQSLCVPSASAAVIASAALHGAPSVTAGTLFSHTLWTMTASTIIKTSVVTLALVSIPLTMLWRENSNLKQEVRELRQASGPVVKAAQSLSVIARAPEDPVKASAAAAAQKASENPMAAFASVFAGDNLVRIAEEQLKHEATRELNRLAQRLNLTPEQKEKLLKFLEGQHRNSINQLKLAVESGLLNRAVKGKENLSAEDQKALEQMDADEDPTVKMDPFLEKLLTPDQLAEYGKAKNEKRVAEAEEHAHDVLSSIGKKVDLTAEQKDRIFQELAQRKLELEKKPSTLNAEGGVNLSATMAEFDNSNDDVLRGILTEEQFKTYEQSRAEEERQMKDVLKVAVPWMPQAGKEEAAK